MGSEAEDDEMAGLPNMLDRPGWRRGPRSPCERCAHMLLDTSTRFHKPEAGAFPDGIPIAIQRGEMDHTEAVDGDHGYRFMPQP